MTKTLQSKVTLGLFLTVTSYFSCLANPLFGLEGSQDVELPFDKCTVYKLGGKKGYPLTHDTVMKDGSKLAFYPLTDEETMLYLHVMLPDVMFKVKIEGSMVSLQKCNRFGRNCAEEEQEGVKYPDYITAQAWNQVKIRLNEESLTIHIGPRMIKSMSMVEYNNLENAYWSVLVRDKPIKSYNPNEPDYLYLVQFMCNDFVTRENPTSSPTSLASTTTTTVTSDDSEYDTTPGYNEYETGNPTDLPDSLGTAAPHIENPEEEDSTGKGFIGLIVGLVVAAIILIVLVIVVYNVIRKRQSFKVNEKAPLQNEQTAK